MTSSHNINPRTVFFETDTPKFLIFLNGIFSLLYFLTLIFLFPIGNPVLFSLLIIGEVFHLFQVMTFLYTIWETGYESPRNTAYAPSVDVFITVAGEPVELVAETVRAAKAMTYPSKEIYILNDGYVAKKDNWQDIEALAVREGIHCITRRTPGGAKAGNINNALLHTQGELVSIFDADHVPHEDFLEKTVPYMGFADAGFVQTPQYYKNFALNRVTRGSWDQQQLFFGPICKGKNRLNSATMCGTNMLISRKALMEVGGMSEESIAEDFVTGLLMHARKYRSVYLPEVLAEGLATEDLLTYTKQQFRWARGALDVIFRYNPLFLRGLTMAQRIQYLSSASFYLSGLVIAIDAVLPLFFFYFHLIPLGVSGMLLALVFLPYIVITLYVVQRSCNFTFSFPSLAFSMGSFNIHIAALVSSLSGKAATFSITAKHGVRGNYLRLVKIHLIYDALVIVGVVVALMREGLSGSVVNNAAWAFVTALVTIPIVHAALPEPEHAAKPVRAVRAITS